MSFLLTYIYRLCNTIALRSIATWYKINFPTTYKLKLTAVSQNISKFFLISRCDFLVCMLITNLSKYFMY